MLEGNKELFAQNANLLPGWKEMSRSDLCRKYIEYKEAGDPLQESCLSAIIYKFWNVINYNFYNQQFELANEQDCYDWNIDAILYALDKHAWTDPDSDLSKDENGPEKAIGVAITSGRANFYTHIKRDKRKLNYGVISLDYLQEDSSDGYFIPYEDEDVTAQDFIKTKVLSYFNKKDYFPAFIIDHISNAELFDSIEDHDTGRFYSVFNVKTLWKVVSSIDDKYVNNFAELYKLDLDVVVKAVSYMKKIPLNEFEQKTERLFQLLAHDKDFISYLRGDYDQRLTK